MLPCDRRAILQVGIIFLLRNELNMCKDEAYLANFVYRVLHVIVRQFTPRVGVRVGGTMIIHTLLSSRQYTRCYRGALVLLCLTASLLCYDPSIRKCS